jgi:uncharacterized protein
MAKGKCSLFLPSVICLLPFAMLLATPHYPQPQGYITDAANVLDSASRQQLENQLSSFQQTTSIEIAVVTVPSLEGETVESYANGLFSQWRVGKKDKNNGLLILLAPSEHRTRIEVGYGLEPVLTDGLCGQIIREQMIPRFKEGHYGQGLAEAITAIEGILAGGTVPAPPRRNTALPIRGLAYFALVGLYALPFTTVAAVVAFLIFFFGPLTSKFFGFLLIPIGLVLDTVRYRSSWGGLSAGRGYYGGWSSGGFGGFGGGGGFGGFGGGSSGGGGASGGW